MGCACITAVAAESHDRLQFREAEKMCYDIRSHKEAARWRGIALQVLLFRKRARTTCNEHIFHTWLSPCFIKLHTFFDCGSQD